MVGAKWRWNRWWLVFWKIVKFLSFLSSLCIALWMYSPCHSNVITTNRCRLLITYYVPGSLLEIYVLLPLIKPKKKYYYNLSETIKLMESKWLDQGQTAWVKWSWNFHPGLFGSMAPFHSKWQAISHLSAWRANLSMYFMEVLGSFVGLYLTHGLPRLLTESLL